MKLLKIFVISFVAFLYSGCSLLGGNKYKELNTVSYVDPKLYAGRWYEIASFPQRFQKGCVATMATYTLREDGDIDVLNECRFSAGTEKWMMYCITKSRTAFKKWNLMLHG